MSAVIDTTVEKSKATWKALYALGGYEAHELADGSFIVSRWGLLSEPLPNLKALAEFASKVGIE